jgi:hypothetical protein
VIGRVTFAASALSWASFAWADVRYVVTGDALLLSACATRCRTPAYASLFDRGEIVVCKAEASRILRGRHQRHASCDRVAPKAAVAFRDRGLAVEDRIVAMNGVPLALRERISPASASGPMR